MSLGAAGGDLSCEQRRVRHLVGIAARNVCCSSGNGGDPEVPSMFFTLHATPTSIEFYRSNAIQSRNPTWHQFDPKVDFSSHAPLSSSRLTVRVWAQPPPTQTNGAPSVLIQWDISLFSLEFLGKHMPSDSSFAASGSTDAIVFQMWDGHFHLPPPTNSGGATPSSASALSDDAGTSLFPPLQSSIPRLDSARVKRTYAYAYLRRLLEQHRNLQTANDSTSLSRKKLLTALEKQGIDPKLQKDVEQSRLRRQLLRQELAEQTDMLHAAKQQLADTQTNLADRSKSVEDALANLQLSVEGVLHANSELGTRITRLRHILSLVQTRQAALVSSLSDVFPIVQTGNSIGSICGIEIPDSPTPQDDERIAAALGYVCHLVVMVAKHIDLTLRFTIRPMCSRTIIAESIQDQELLLFPRNKEQFDLGTRLLHKIVEQIVCYCGVPDASNQPNSTLKNLKALFNYLNEGNHNAAFPNLTKTHTALGGLMEFNGVACYRYALVDLQERLPANLSLRLGQPPVASNFKLDGAKIVLLNDMQKSDHALSKLLTLTDVSRDCFVLVEQ